MIKTLMGSIRDYMKVAVATPLLVLGEVLCEMLIPFITANLIDAIKDGTTVAEMLPTAGFLVLIALTSLAFGAAAGVTCSHASCGFAKNLRHDLFYKIQTFSFANIDEFSSSSLVTRLTTDINNVQQAFMMIIRIAVRAPLVLIFAFTMAFIMGGSVAMGYLVIIPLLGFGLFFIIFKVRPIFSRVFHKYDALNESVEENVTGMRVVKSYVREDFEKEKFATAARDVQMDFTRAEKLLAFNNPMMNICVNGAFVVIIYLGSKLIITSQGTLFDVGQLSSIFTYGFQILMSLMQLSMIFVMVTMADESAHRITEVLAAEPTIADPAEPVLEVADGSIDFDHVSFKYSAHAKRQALDDIDLHIKSGETIGIIGVGRIGSRIAKRMQAMEMKTIGYDPYIPEERFKQLGVEQVDLDTLFKRSDYITMHTPLTKETRGLIGKEEIAKMKDGVRVINVSRGAVLDIYALAEALKSGHVAGAAIDVFPTEPLTKDINPFLGMDNVVITPHLGASTVEAQIGVSVDVAEGVMEALKGEPVATAVNMAPVPPNVYNVIHPYFDLMERMGNLAVYLADAPMKEIEVEYTGELADTETRLLTTAVLKGALNPILQESVNYVNAAEVAKTRHIAIKEINSQSNGYFVNSVTVRVRTNKGEHAIVGVLFNGTEAKIVQIDEYRVDFTPEGYLLLVPHVDQPNMIGQISTILGQAHINIMGMQVGRMTKSGNNIMAIAVQDDIPNDIMVKLRSINGILDMKLIHCDIH